MSDDDSEDSDDVSEQFKASGNKFDEIPQYDPEVKGVKLKKDRLVDLKIPEGLITANATLAENFIAEYRKARENGGFGRRNGVFWCENGVFFVKRCF